MIKYKIKKKYDLDNIPSSYTGNEGNTTQKDSNIQNMVHKAQGVFEN